MTSGATTSAGREKKDGGSAGRVLVAMRVAMAESGLGHIAAPGSIIRLKPFCSYLMTQGNDFL